MAKNSAPKNFKESIDWTDWKATLINFRKSPPRINGVPLIYVIRYNITPTVGGKLSFIDYYVNRSMMKEIVLP